MSNESERWNRLKTDLMNIKFNEVDQNTLRLLLNNFNSKLNVYFKTIWIRQISKWLRTRVIPGHARVKIRPAYRLVLLWFLVLKWHFTKKDLNYVDIDPLFREHDLTKWNSLLCDKLDASDTKQDIQQQLLHERQRLSSTKGVTGYLVTDNRILYQSHGRFNYTDNHLGT